MRKMFMLLVVVLAGCQDDGGPASTGSIEVDVVIAPGGTPDPDGFRIEVEGDTVTVPSTGGTAEFGRVPVGVAVVKVLGLAPWCDADPRIQATTAVAGQLALVGTTIQCDTAFGAVRLITSALGVDVDPDGYIVAAGGTDHAAGARDTTIILLPSQQVAHLAIRGIGRTCWATSDSIRTATPTLPGDTVDIQFHVDCGVILYKGYPPGGPQRLFQVNVTNGQVRPMAAFNYDFNRPNSSPDGSTIIFSGFQVFRTTPNGDPPVQLSNVPEQPVWADWLHADTVLVYSMWYGTPISIADLPAGTVTPIPGSTSPEDGAVVRPGGVQLAYQKRDSAFTTIAVWTMNINGSDRKPAFASAPEFSFAPSWSPSGDRLAFAGWGAGGSNGIYVGTPGAAAATAITHPAYPYSSDHSPRWSGDGRLIAFARHSDLDARDYLFLVHPDGTGLRPVQLPHPWGYAFTWLR